ncbi:MAG TPA: peptide chain release factor N(5)-glutamine methyltransferase [Methylococcaceae bacterium]|nr:peptide chain release factor N(5)-glutamine methyltransferase [Methylococcaceae bacterium]
MTAPLTIAAVLREAAAKLVPVCDPPQFEAEALLSHVLEKNRAHLRAWPERELSSEQAVRFLALLERRARGEPTAYLTGSREFWSREFRVTREVLIPRPETELLVDLALERLPVERPVRVLDLGTGSGALAVTLALERPLAEVTAVDACPRALEVARGNALRMSAANVRFVLSDWFSAIPETEFDLIVSNPPYVAAEDPHLQENGLPFEPIAALAAGTDGLDAIRRIVPAALFRLAPGGALLLEHGYDQGAAVQDLLAEAGFRAVVTHADLQGHPRVTLGGV